MNSLWGVAADPSLRMFLQPDGTTFTGSTYGDEFLALSETEDGYTFLWDWSDEWYYYAETDAAGDPDYTLENFDNLFFSQGTYITDPNTGLPTSPDGEEVFGSINDYWREVSYEDACYRVHAADLAGQPSSMTSPRCKPYVPQRLAQMQLPQRYTLHRNHPNPFNPTTTIRYDLPEASYVSLMIYDILGREVRTLLDSRVVAGFKSVVWNGRDDTGNSVSTGIYIYALKAWSLESEQTYQKTEKMVLLR